MGGATRAVPEAQRSELDLSARVVRFIYNLALAAAFPLLVLYYAYRVTLGGKSGQGFLQRLGFLPADMRRAFERSPGEKLVWLHAVSVGEVSAAHPIIRELVALEPDVRLALSVPTATGYQHAVERVRERCALFYLPLDLPLCVTAAFRAVKPDLLVIMETELWPNLLDRARVEGVPVLIANGRVSDHSFRRAAKARPLYRGALSCVSWLCMQSRADGERIAWLGADPGRVLVLGNSKFDESCPDVDPASRAALRAEYGIAPEAPVLIYGSTGQGEDALRLDAFRVARMAVPGLRLIHAPRHPERGEEVRALADERGFAAVRRSLMREGKESPLGRDCVIVLDTIGELTPLYAIADVVFVGRSLVPQGGGNVLQPLYYGKPVLVGPHTTNMREMVRVARQAEVCIVVEDGEALAEAVARLLSDAAEREAIAARAGVIFEENRGASQRYARAAIAALRGEPVSVRA